ncbi:MAG: hypothetical protein LBF23_02810 [Endomicrobium sp.]|nr:hypothetical protein [Endomicrobium sp.]
MRKIVKVVSLGIIFAEIDNGNLAKRSRRTFCTGRLPDDSGLIYSLKFYKFFTFSC